ncbi:MAG: hypothetical protein A3F35_01615 [Candidatus Woykebacteria bacterium RIFCSPHIGHO2_12_FULL_45_10]|uniref:Uncharacterized protein n=1 Tax=Candidatus Woykebacteria bacterium RIFCSPHIGHO2_12_FULL_45_10 TaxID=1802603 RepID=A0A1G1WNB1_9BACT|nr:MAG: hypothetical protein A3F35_01615 [Candidatus Woykebacteria bacterium RIFCSPHIGHO2_12_FULL_45_10]
MIIFSLLSLFVTSTFAFAYIIFFLPPKIAGQLVPVNLIYFFISGFLFLALGTSLVLYSAGSFLERGGRQDLTKLVNRPKFILRKSLRRGFLFSATVFLLGGFHLLGIFNPLNFVLLILVSGLAEFYFTSSKA